MIQRINHLNLEQEIGLKKMTNHEEHIMIIIIIILILIIIIMIIIIITLSLKSQL